MASSFAKSCCDYESHGFSHIFPVVWRGNWGSVGALLPSVTGFGGAGGIRGICPGGSGLVAWEAGGCRVGGRQQWGEGIV